MPHPPPHPEIYKRVLRSARCYGLCTLHRKSCDVYVMKFSKRYLLCFYIVSPSFYFSNVTIWNVVIKLKHWYKSKNDFNSLRVNDQKNSMWRQIYWIFMSFYQEEGRVVCGAKSQKEREDYLIPLLDTVGTSMLFRPFMKYIYSKFWTEDPKILQSVLKISDQREAIFHKEMPAMAQITDSTGNVEFYNNIFNASVSFFNSWLNAWFKMWAWTNWIRLVVLEINRVRHYNGENKHAWLTIFSEWKITTFRILKNNWLRFNPLKRPFSVRNTEKNEWNGSALGKCHKRWDIL